MALRNFTAIFLCACASAFGDATAGEDTIPATAAACAADTLPSARRDAAVARRLDEMARYADARIDTVYKRVGDVACTMDVFLPKTRRDAAGKPLYPDGAPCVLYFHGGGWAAGSRYGRLEGIALPESIRFFSERGMAVALVSYRFIGATRFNGLTVEDCVKDAFDAARFLASQAKTFDIDPTRFLVCGGSAGGHLALMLLYADASAFVGDAALAREKIGFIGGVTRAAPTSLAEPYFCGAAAGDFPAFFERAIGHPYAAGDALAKKVSPLAWVRAGAPRVLLLHGDADTTVSCEWSERLAARAKAVGAEATYLKIPNANHHLKGRHQPLAALTRNIFLCNLYEMAHESVAAKKQ